MANGFDCDLAIKKSTFKKKLVLFICLSQTKIEIKKINFYNFLKADNKLIYLE